jgi:hypothetical protein
VSLAVLNAAALDDLIGQFGNATLIAKGALLVLSVESIRERSGGRWPVRQETVREFTERQFQKYFQPSDQLVRLDDVHFLVVQPLESGFGAQARALKLLGDVLVFFLGASAGRDMRLSRVTRISSDGVEVTPVEVSDADLARLATMDWGVGSTKRDDRADLNLPAGSVGPRMAVIDVAKVNVKAALKGDRSYEAMFVIEPIWSIRHRAVVSHLLRPLIFELQADRRVDANLANASPGDLVRLDLAVLAEATRIFREEGAGKHFALHIPIHHGSLAVATSRLTLLAALERVQPGAASSVVVVLSGLAAGAPHSQIVGLTSALANRCRGGEVIDRFSKGVLQPLRLNPIDLYRGKA